MFTDPKSQNNEDQILDKTLRPYKFEEYFGQEKIKKNLKILLEAAKKRGDNPEHLLIYGSSGLGKTTLAHIIAKELGVNIKTTSGPAIEKIGDLASILTNLEKGDVLFIDECLEKDTLISLANGSIKKIKDIKNGDKVIGGKVTSFFKKKVNSTLKIETSYSSLECSENHPCIIMRNGEMQTVLAKNLKTTDYFLLPISLPHISKNDLTPSQTTFLAMIICDGHIAKNELTIQVETSKDKKYFKQIFEKGVKAFGITPEYLEKESRKRKLESVISCKTTTRGTQLLRIYSKGLVKKLISFGIPIGKKSNLVDVPNAIFLAPLESVKAFIDTCFCCEGWVGKGAKGERNLHLSMTSPLFLQKLQLLLKKFEIQSYFRKLNRHNSYRLDISANDRLKFVEKIGLSMERKLELCKNTKRKPRTDLIPVPALLKNFGSIDKDLIRWRYTAFTKQGPSRYPHLTRTKLEEIHDYINNITLLKKEIEKYLNYKYIPIKRIKKIKKSKTVYDFTTTEHYFIANGMITHNCHRLNKLIEEYIYPAMEEFSLNIIIGKGPSARSIQLELPPFTLIAATTRISLLTSPLRNRFGATYHLDFYEQKDIENILNRSSKILKVNSDIDGIKEIAKRARRTPRVANRLLKRVRDYAQVHGQGKIDKSIAREALAMLEIDDLGLEPVDRLIVKTIIEKFNGGPVGLDTLAAATSEEKDTICDIYEPYLMQLGFLARTPKGRVATNSAYKHLGLKSPKEAQKKLIN